MKLINGKWFSLSVYHHFLSRYTNQNTWFYSFFPLSPVTILPHMDWFIMKMIVGKATVKTIAGCSPKLWIHLIFNTFVRKLSIAVSSIKWNQSSEVPRNDTRVEYLITWRTVEADEYECSVWCPHISGYLMYLCVDIRVYSIWVCVCACDVQWMMFMCM